jgi:GT2 family glycosyltransferase
VPETPVSVVVATRNRRDRLLATLAELTALPEKPGVVVVDNGSGDGSAGAVRRHFPGVTVLPLPANEGAAARNAGARLAATPYVAFSDDDSWWQPGALAGAAAALDADPRLALIAGAVMVGQERLLDPTSAAMAASPLGEDLGPFTGGSGRRGILGFLACGVVVRRDAFLAAGGFPAGLGVGSEEEPLALALGSMGWRLAYEPSVVAVHHPGSANDQRRGRRRVAVRNRLLTAWTMLPATDAAHHTVRALRSPVQWPAVADALGRWPWIVAHRHRVPARVAAARRRLTPA